MSRFKEMRRIDDAIKHKNKEELSWALNYTKMRFQSAVMKHHEKHWRKLIRQIQEVIDDQGKNDV